MTMAVYSVYAPPAKQPEDTVDPETFAFVRDGFSFWAFLFGPLWMLRHRMWLVLPGYILLLVVVELGLHFLRVSGTASTIVSLLVALLVGLEAAPLRAFTFRRRKWPLVGVIAANDRDAAERRFFSLWAENGGAIPAASAPLPAVVRSPSAADVIGLFPVSGTPQ
jgi:hypothetical protein